jgi:hypothetical protein
LPAVFVSKTTSLIFQQPAGIFLDFFAILLAVSGGRSRT